MLKLYKNYEPAVSIILPTFNRVDLLPRAVESVLQQTFKKFELIVVDDGSTDSTFEYINKHLSVNHNIRYLKHSNRKLAISLNTGIAVSCGNYLMFLGSDDELKPDHLERRVDYMNAHPHVDLIHGGVVVIGNPYVPDKNDSSKQIHLEQCTIGGTFFGKRKIFIELDGFKDIQYSEDSEFMERAAQKYKVEKIDFPTYIYHRDTPGSITNSM